MERSEVQKWVNENIDRLVSLFGIQHWRIQVFYEAMSSDDAGDLHPLMRVNKKPEYERAAIRINYPALVDFEQLEESFKHELMHIVAAPFDTAWAVIAEMLTDEQMKVVDRLWTQAEELTVRNLERMHNAHLEANDA